MWDKLSPDLFEVCVFGKRQCLGILRFVEKERKFREEMLSGSKRIDVKHKVEITLFKSHERL